MTDKSGWLAGQPKIPHIRRNRQQKAAAMSALSRDCDTWNSSGNIWEAIIHYLLHSFLVSLNWYICTFYYCLVLKKILKYKISAKIPNELNWVHFPLLAALSVQDSRSAATQLSCFRADSHRLLQSTVTHPTWAPERRCLGTSNSYLSTVCVQLQIITLSPKEQLLAFQCKSYMPEITHSANYLCGKSG